VGIAELSVEDGAVSYVNSNPHTTPTIDTVNTIDLATDLNGKAMVVAQGDGAGPKQVSYSDGTELNISSQMFATGAPISVSMAPTGEAIVAFPSGSPTDPYSERYDLSGWSPLTPSPPTTDLTSVTAPVLTAMWDDTHYATLYPVSLTPAALTIDYQEGPTAGWAELDTLDPEHWDQVHIIAAGQTSQGKTVYYIAWVLPPLDAPTLEVSSYIAGQSALTETVQLWPDSAVDSTDLEIAALDLVYNPETKTIHVWWVAGDPMGTQGQVYSNTVTGTSE
jgi:hypothetical protein